MTKISITLLFLLAASCAHHRPHGTVVFMSDFGNRDHSVAVCKAAMLNVNPGLRIIDLTHETPPFNIRHAASILSRTVRYYPAETAFVAVIDPGVGSPRNPMAVKTKKGHYLVGPDNGVFSSIFEEEGIEKAVKLDQSKYYFPLREVSSTFHGRDIFSSVAAHLASGLEIEKLGAIIEKPVVLDNEKAVTKNGGFYGIVLRIEEPYGNVLTNIPVSLLETAGIHINDVIKVQIGAKKYKMPYKKTFSDVGVGEILALADSDGNLSFSINQGSFSAKESLVEGLKINVSR